MEKSKTYRRFGHLAGCDDGALERLSRMQSIKISSFDGEAEVQFSRLSIGQPMWLILNCKFDLHRSDGYKCIS